jgi:hypothetical protein
MLELWLLLTAITLVAAYQAYVTLIIARSGLLTRVQRLSQVALIWVLPMVGAAICHSIYRLHGTFESTSKFPQDSMPDPLQPGPVNELVD